MRGSESQLIWFLLSALGVVSLLAGLFGLRFAVRISALAKPAESIARRHLKSLRVRKQDKPTVMILSLQKAGSTLLCYAGALVNTRNQIENFRNDFDLVPMLSFPQTLIHQNINARQDGKFQLYKINGRVKHLYRLLTDDVGVGRVLWSSREFGGYYQSVYWWVTKFYARVKPYGLPFPILFFLRYLSWGLFRKLTLHLLARDHVQELRFAYELAKSTPPDRFLALSYEHMTREKVATLQTLADWFGVEVDAASLQSIAEKTSKEAMAQGDRFDPVSFGDGVGQTKVNLEPHPHKLSAAELEIYDGLFKQEFSGTGITTYAEYIEAMRRLRTR